MRPAHKPIKCPIAKYARKSIVQVFQTLLLIISPLLSCLLEERSCNLLDGNQQKQGEEGLPRAPEQTHPLGAERNGPLGLRDAHWLCPHSGQGCLSASTGHCRAWLGPHPPGARSQVQAHPSNAPRCTAGGGLLHSSLSGEEVFAQVLCRPPTV